MSQPRRAPEPGWRRPDNQSDREPAMLIDALDIAGILAACAVVICAALVLAVLARQAWLRRNSSGVLCAMRPAGGHSPWQLGVLRYGRTSVRWYRLLSLAPGPAAVFVRRGTAVLERRPAAAGVRHVLPGAATVARCRAHTLAGGWVDLDMAFSGVAWTGFLTWLESVPPDVSGALLPPGTSRLPENVTISEADVEVAGEHEEEIG